MVKQIKELHEFDCMAIIDASDQFWSRQHEGNDTDNLLKEVFAIK